MEGLRSCHLTSFSLHFATTQTIGNAHRTTTTLSKPRRVGLRASDNAAKVFLSYSVRYCCYPMNLLLMKFSPSLRRDFFMSFVFT